MNKMNGFKLAYHALINCTIDEKIKLTQQLYALSINHQLDYSNAFPIQKTPDPGRPQKPELVRFQSVPQRDKTDLGFINTIHAICHIEFNAINLALDAIYRF